MSDAPKLLVRPPEEELNEIARAALHDERVLRMMALVIDEEIGRKQICWALQITESDLSRKLSGQPDRDGNARKPCYRMLRYCLVHEQADRLKKLILVDQGPCLPPLRRDRASDEEVRRRIDERIAKGDALSEVLEREIYGAAHVSLVRGVAK
jgi:hypothetical protein